MYAIESALLAKSVLHTYIVFLRHFVKKRKAVSSQQSAFSPQPLPLLSPAKTMSYEESDAQNLAS
jgi:hypothetical protein